MRKIFILFTALFLLSAASFGQIITLSTGKLEIPNVTLTDGPLGTGSVLWFASGDNNTAIQENWGLNITGDAQRPVKIYNTSLLVGYTSSGASYGSNNAYISGQVGIGTTSVPIGYVLGINGGAIATSFTIMAYGSWPDYVFKPSYHLTPLSEVKTYVDLNHHLPEIPSEKEIATNGLNLGDIDRLLTKKVEELTLYLIDKDKQLAKQQQQIDSQDERIKKLEDALTKFTVSKDKSQ